MLYACDVDGVVAKFAQGFSLMLYTLDGKDRLPIIDNNDQEEWDWNTWYAHDKINRSELKSLIERAWEDHIKVRGNSIWSGLNPLYPDTMEMLNKEARDNPIVFMTRRDGPGAWQETSSWLHRYGIDNPMVYVIRPGEEKGDVCKKMGIDIIIDDSPIYAKELLSNGIKVVMPRFEYNKKFIREYYTNNENLYPVAGLEQSLRIVKHIKENR